MLKELFPRAEVRVPSIRNGAALTAVFSGDGTAEAEGSAPRPDQGWQG